MPNTPEPGFLDLFDVRRLAARDKSGLERPVQLGFLLLFLLVVIGSWVTYRHTQRLHDHKTFLAQSHEVVDHLRSVVTRLADCESGARAFFITNDESYLDAYEIEIRALDSELAGFSDLARRDSEFVAACAVLRTQVAERQEHLARVVALARAGDQPGVVRLVKSGDGQRLMNKVRASVAALEAREREMLETRQANATLSYETARATGLGLALLGVTLVVGIYNLVRRYERLRARSARQVAESRKRFEVALASIGDAVLVTDSLGRIAYCNKGCQSILGITDTDIGRDLGDIITTSSASDGDSLNRVVQRVCAEGGMLRGASDAMLRHSDGSTVPVDFTVSALHGASGETEGVVVVVLDVSERRDRERELARSSERFKSLVLASSQIVWTTDADGYVREDSPTWRTLTGQTYEQWKGHGWLEALHPDDRQRVLDEWMEAVRAKRPFPVEYRLRMIDGTYRWNMVRAVPVLDTDGAIREWVGMNYDVQSRKEAEAAQQDASRRKDEFISLLAHELRNPLAPLRNGIEILKARQDAGSARAIEMMDRQVRHMVRLIDDLLDLSRITRGQLELRSKRLDLREILRQAVDGVMSTATAKHQTLSVSLPAEALWVLGDDVRLTQVVTNLLNNAIKYSGEHASIWLTADRDGSHHQISVRDTGQGIPPEMRASIWDLFLQGGGRAERVEGGLGIGLTLVKRIVELHNGTVDVASDGVGTGSEFTVRLPVAAAMIGSPPAAPVPARAAIRALRILVIDDNEDSAESLSMLLRVDGHTLKTAFSGEAGLEEFERFRPDVVLCDIRMPDISGYEVARRLCARPDGRKPVLVALTGFGTAADRESSARAGFDCHLVKPVDPDALVEILRSAAVGPPKG